MLKQEIELAYEEALARDPQRAAEALRRFAEGLVDRKILFDSQPHPATLKPHFLPQPLVRKWARAAERLVALINRISPLVRAHDELYQCLGLPAELRRYIDVDPGYEPMAIICRPDGIYDGEALQLLEVNADCPAGVGRDDQLEQLVLSLFPMTELRERWQLRGGTRVQGLLDALLGAYRAWGGTKSHPRIAMVGWREDKNNHDRLSALAEFERQGYPSLLIDPRELSLREGRLWGRGEPIDIVNRRLMLHVFHERPDDLAVLLRAYESGAVCMAAPLSVEVATSKALLALLHSPAFQPQLREDERALLAEFVPPSFVVEKSHQTRLRAEQRSFILKPANGYAGKGVTFGGECDAPTWNALLDRIFASRETWIAQHYIPAATYEIVEAVAGRPHPKTLNVIWSPWIQGGSFNGITVRGSSSWCVNITGGGCCLPGLAYEGIESRSSEEKPLPT